MFSPSRMLGKLLARYLQKQIKTYNMFAASDPDALEAILQPGDILLVEGNLRISTAIKYLTQSTWSHSAMYVGDVVGSKDKDGNAKVLIEADIIKGVIASPLAKYKSFNIRICRPLGVTSEDKMKILNYMMKSLGNSYDLKNVIDLMRYLLPQPPVPSRFRRRMIALGSGDPTRAICSSLIAQAYQAVNYPILPTRVVRQNQIDYSDKEILKIRHHSLFTPRDFDLSPYFEVVKPTINQGFDYQTIVWADTDATDNN